VSELGQQRHRARERALELAYEATLKERAAAEILREVALRPDPYTVALLDAFDMHHEAAKNLIERYALGWDYERMAIIDRLVMVLAVCESRMEDAPPHAVILDEAVELAKTYSTDGSGSFVNGVLVACLNDHEE
jgi:N utilization substance protein B